MVNFVPEVNFKDWIKLLCCMFYTGCVKEMLIHCKGWLSKGLKSGEEMKIRMNPHSPYLHESQLVLQ